MPTEITRSTTVKKFLKENTKLRVGSDAIPVMLSELNDLSLTVVQKAEKLSEAEKRTTILPRDIQEAFKSLSGVERTPEGLFKVIETMEPEEVGKLSLLIAQWVKEQRKNLGIGL